MVRLLSLVTPSVFLLTLLLTQSPMPTSAVTIRDIITSAFSSWSSPEVKDESESRSAAEETDLTEEDAGDDSDARIGEDAEVESAAEEEVKRSEDEEEEKNDTERVGEKEQEDRNSYNQPSHHGIQAPPVALVHTVFATITHYIQVTSTKNQIPMCVTAHVPLPPCSPPTYEESRPPYPWWRTARNRPVSEEEPDKSAEEDSEAENRMLGNPLSLFNPMNLLNPLQHLNHFQHLNPFQHLFPKKNSTTTESPGLMGHLHHMNPFKDTHLHVHFEKKKDPLKDPFNPNNPAHPLNPAHASNVISGMNGLLSAATGFVGAFTGGRDGIKSGPNEFTGGHPTGHQAGHPGGHPGGHNYQPLYYPRVITELVTRTSVVTKVVTSTESYLTATVVAQNCLPNSDTVSHCHPATTVVPYRQPYQIRNPPYEAYYQETPVLGGAAPVDPSVWLMAAPYLAGQTPPLSLQEPWGKTFNEKDIPAASNEVEVLEMEGKKARDASLVEEATPMAE